MRIAKTMGLFTAALGLSLAPLAGCEEREEVIYEERKVDVEPGARETEHTRITRDPETGVITEQKVETETETRAD